MKYSVLEKLDKTAVDQIIVNAWELEARRDIDAAIENFAPLWADLETEPDFSEFDLTQQAVLYRLSGFFLSIYGNARNLKNFQERAKNLLFIATEFFARLDDRDGLADSQNVLAVCYTNEGSLLEAETILEQVAEMFLGDCLHPVYLRNRINFLQIKQRRKQYQVAFEIIEEMRIPLEFCKDLRSCALFHEKAGIIYRGLQQYDKAIWHYHEALRFAYQLNNLFFIVGQRNNLAFLYNKIKNFELAHTNINEALKLVKENNLIGFLPIYLDTQALIFASEGCFELALKIIDEAISIYRNGDDYYGLTESIWNKCKFLLNLDRKDEAIILFTEMIPIAGQQMGEFAVKNFTKEFADLIHIKQEGSLDDELRRFKRVEIVNAIHQSNYNLFDAADALKINVSALTKALDKEFPELYDELDIQHAKKFSEKKESVQNKAIISAPRKISQLNLQDVGFSFESEAPEKFSVFYVSNEKLAKCKKDIVVAITPSKEVIADDYILVQATNNIYSFGKVQHDTFLNLSYILDKEEDLPIFLNDVKIIGKAFAYCPFDEIDNDQLHFQPLNF